MRRRIVGCDVIGRQYGGALGETQAVAQLLTPRARVNWDGYEAQLGTRDQRIDELRVVAEYNPYAIALAQAGRLQLVSQLVGLDGEVAEGQPLLGQVAVLKNQAGPVGFGLCAGGYQPAENVCVEWIGYGSLLPLQDVDGAGSGVRADPAARVLGQRRGCLRNLAFAAAPLELPGQLDDLRRAGSPDWMTPRQ